MARKKSKGPRVERFGNATLYLGDCREIMAGLDAASVHSVVTDPPYGLSREPDMHAVLEKWITGEDYKASGAGFMQKAWDSFVPGPATWAEAERVLKPGGHLVAFAGSRTYDLMAVSIRLAGFHIRDQLMWLYGSGFPKSHDVAKAIDKAHGVEGSYGAPKSAAHAEMLASGKARRGTKQEGWDRPWMDDPQAIANAQRRYIPGSEDARRWEGWGTALKPAHEPIVLARRPFRGSVAANVVAHGTSALNVEACRAGDEALAAQTRGVTKMGTFEGAEGNTTGERFGRWPANVLHDGSFDVLEAFGRNMAASRFFYAAKADREFGLRDGGVGALRDGKRATKQVANFHPTVKPIDLMRWLARLVTPPGGTVLEPFMGSGSTGIACVREGFAFVGIEQDPDYFDMACRRVAAAVDEAARMPDLVVQVDRAVAAIRAAKQLDLALDQEA